MAPDMDMGEDWGSRVERFRPYLQLMARLQQGNRMKAKFSSSDLVQQTLLEAYEQRDQFRGQTDGEFAAWLRRILVHNLADAFRAQARAKRRADLERSLEQAIGQSSARLIELIAASEPSPSRKAVRDEDVLRLAVALEALPGAQRETVERHHLQGESLKETAEAMGRSPEAVAGLLHRALMRLKEHLRE